MKKPLYILLLCVLLVLAGCRQTDTPLPEHDTESSGETVTTAPDTAPDPADLLPKRAVSQLALPEIGAMVTNVLPLDRATLIELMPGSEYFPEEHGGFRTAYEWAASYPHLKDKLDCMGEYTEKVFGSVYWTP